MKSHLLLPCFVSIVLCANQPPFTSENPYESINAIEEKQIKGENFKEVYENQNQIENSSFDFFRLLHTDDSEDNPEDIPCNPATENCNPTVVPIPVPIHHYSYLLLMIGIGLMVKFKSFINI